MADIQTLKADLERELAEMKTTNARNAQLMAMLEARAAEAPAPVQGGGIDAGTLEAILKRTTDAASAGSQLLASKMKPENADHEHVSPFEHPDGGLVVMKPALVREMWFGGFRLRESELAFAEVVALNELSATLTRSQKRLAHNGLWIALVSDDDARLSISVPMKTIDQRSDLPAFMLIVRELTDGVKALDVADMAADLAIMREKIARLEGAAA